MTTYATREEDEAAEETTRRRRYVVQGFDSSGYWSGPGGAVTLDGPPAELFDDDTVAFLSEDGDILLLQDDS